MGSQAIRNGWMIGFTMILWVTACEIDRAWGSIVLVDNGQARAVIVLPDDPADLEQHAADELVEHIKLMSGVALPVVTAGANIEGRLPILIGAAADDALAENVMRRQAEERPHWNIEYRLEQGGDTFAFALWVTGEAVQLRGGMGPAGTRTAAYEVLEQLGVRWYMPGKYGRIIPKKTTLELALQQTIQVPSFVRRQATRRPTRDPHYDARARLGGLGSLPGTHGFPKPDGLRHRQLRSEHPEYYGLRANGERGGRQLCVSNPDVIDLVARAIRQRLDAVEAPADTRRIISVGPHDGGGHCLCADCRALDAPDHVTTPLATPEPSKTDRYVWFINKVLEALEDDYPNVRIGMYAYASYQLPPERVEPTGRLVISIAPIHQCRHHGPNNPNCPESSYVPWLYENWQPYVNEIWCRGYLYNLACPGLPISLTHRLREEVPLWYEMGVIGYEADYASTFATYNPGPFLRNRLTWDHTLDVDELLQDFYHGFYGPAAEPMEAYHTLIDKRHGQSDYHTGASWDIPNFYPERVRVALRGYLEEAEGLVEEGSDDAVRVEITRKGFEWLDAYCNLMDRRNRHDFIAEMEYMEEMREILTSLQEDYDARMLDQYLANWLQRFIGRISDETYATLAGGGEIVAPFSPEWKFRQDPEQWGRYIGLHKPESEGGNWQTIRTDTSWSNQGLRYYYGQAWYRQTVEVPAEYDGRTVYLWFAGVDRTAEVWVNGTFVGANHDGAEFDLGAHGSAFRTFEFDATEAIRFGGANVVTVRAVRPRISELGTGGIVGPVMFYVPGRAAVD